MDARCVGKSVFWGKAVDDVKSSATRRSHSLDRRESSPSLPLHEKRRFYLGLLVRITITYCSINCFEHITSHGIVIVKAPSQCESYKTIMEQLFGVTMSNKRGRVEG